MKINVRVIQLMARYVADMVLVMQTTDLASVRSHLHWDSGTVRHVMCVRCSTREVCPAIPLAPLVSVGSFVQVEVLAWRGFVPAPMARGRPANSYVQRQPLQIAVGTEHVWLTARVRAREILWVQPARLVLRGSLVLLVLLLARRRVVRCAPVTVCVPMVPAFAKHTIAV